jgi:biofilm PGA synthesis N-glycosyltransferase PgaC
MNVAVILFWLAIWSLLYVYFGYPLLLWSLARIFPRRLRPVDDAEEPAVTMIVSAYNEEAIIDRKLENCTSLDYPKDRTRLSKATPPAGSGSCGCRTGEEKRSG